MESYLENEFYEHQFITPTVSVFFFFKEGRGKVAQVKLLTSLGPHLFNSEGHVLRGTQTI